LVNSGCLPIADKLEKLSLEQQSWTKDCPAPPTLFCLNVLCSS
jgi:hypothetical protein